MLTQTLNTPEMFKILQSILYKQSEGCSSNREELW